MILADWLHEGACTPEQLRRMLGVRSRSTIHRYLTGARVPQHQVLQKIIELTGGRVQLADFLDPAPPVCAAVVTLEGERRLIFPWTTRDGRLEAAERAGSTTADSWPSPALLSAMETLGPRVTVTRSCKFLLDGRISDARRVVAEANAIRREMGQPEISYPIVRPRHD